MAISFFEATQSLLAGKPLIWEAFENHKAGTLTLSSPQQRRLFAFLLAHDREKVASGHEDLFTGLVTAWSETDGDPASESDNTTKASNQDVWRLDRIEASGFGGLTTFGGPPFGLRVDAKNWCLNGQNGSGKTSLASAILWALTGKRIREQEGPADERGERSPVLSETGSRLGDWPSFASYPTAVADLTKPVEVWVRLSFVNQQGDVAIAYRRMVCPLGGSSSLQVEIDPRLEVARELLETGLLMPARVARIGFDGNSHSLYEAVKMLTGLDHLADIAEGCSNFTHGARHFLRYGKNNGLDHHKERFEEEMSKASEKAIELQFALPEKRILGSETLVADIKRVANNASTEAGKQLATVTADIASTIDTTAAVGRNTVHDAVTLARATLNQGADDIPLFAAWAALKAAKTDPVFLTLPEVINKTRAELDAALSWHEKQTADKKFRLKAIAAQFYEAPHQHSDVARCPLCAAFLSTEDQQILAAQLAELRKDAAEAERKLDDVCRGLLADLTECLPPSIKRHREMLDTMEPKTTYGTFVRNRFCEGPPFHDVLPGLAPRNTSRIARNESKLPSFTFVTFEPRMGEPAAAVGLRRTIHGFNRLLALVEWWAENQGAFRSAWSDTIGLKRKDGTYPINSVQGDLLTLENALSKANPLDALSKSLLHAATAAEQWTTIYQQQVVREAIAEALRPLKDLRTLVNAESARSIANLSTRIKDILDRIHLRERLSYGHTSLSKKAVHVDGSFEAGMQIDAGLVANTSWLRAILWAFVLALREETIEQRGANPFPLMVLDDPQTSFDPRNKRKWAKELARLANMDHKDPRGLQLFLTTHERQFHQYMVDIEHLEGEQGLVGGVNKTTRVATIVNAGWLAKAWQEATDNNDDTRARDYIADVRIYCEDLLKFMLRGEGAQIADLSLDGLKRALKRLRDAHVPPFDRKAFITLTNTLDGGGGAAMNLVNAAHHKDDESIGLAEAADVKEFWESKLMNQIHEAFGVYDQFESFYGEPRTFPWAKTVVQFPSGFGEEVKSLRMQNSGIAAAAKTDGRAGDGLVTVEEWETGAEITLPNHEIYQLAAGTLDPVAAVGDLLVVSNYAKVNPRNLVVAAYGSRLLARRYNELETHPGIAVLTGQSVDPYALPEPLIIAPEAALLRKVVGIIFASRYLPIPTEDRGCEIIPLRDCQVPRRMLDGARLFQVQGRSAEPIALNDQYLITRGNDTGMEQTNLLDGRPVVAIDEDGTRYFKRLRCRGNFAVLESLNQDGTTAAAVLSFNGMNGLPKLVHVREVIGVLFDSPS